MAAEDADARAASSVALEDDRPPPPPDADPPPPTTTDAEAAPRAPSTDETRIPPAPSPDDDDDDDDDDDATAAKVDDATARASAKRAAWVASPTRGPNAGVSRDGTFGGVASPSSSPLASSSSEAEDARLAREIAELRAMRLLVVERGIPLTRKQCDRAAALVKSIAAARPGALTAGGDGDDDDDGGDDGGGGRVGRVGFSAPPRRPAPLPPSLSLAVPIRARLRAAQACIDSLRYNHTPDTYFSINKNRPYARVVDTAKVLYGARDERSPTAPGPLSLRAASANLFASD